MSCVIDLITDSDTILKISVDFSGKVKVNLSKNNCVRIQLITCSQADLQTF